MRIIRHRLNNRIANAAVMVVLCVLLVGLIPIRAVLAAGMEVDLPYKQTWTNESGRKVSNTFGYRMTAADAKSPMPAESSDGAYDFSLKGSESGSKTLHFAFSTPGYYHYTVSPTTDGLSKHYTYRPPVYDVMIMVVNGSSGLQIGAMTIEDSARAQSGDKAKFGALEYQAEYRYEKKPKPPNKPEPQESTPASSPGPGRTTPAPAGGATWTPEPQTPEDPGEVEPVTPQGGDDPEPDGPGIDLEGEDYWALLNLILMILTVIIALIDGILYFRDPDDEEDEEESENGKSSGQARSGTETEDDEEDDNVRKHGLIRILALIVAVISIIVFFLTEDMRLPMEWVDEYTIWMIILFIIEIILAFLSRKTRPDDEEDEEQIE